MPEAQDSYKLLSELGEQGSPEEAAHYLHAGRQEDANNENRCQYVVDPNPTEHPLQFLSRKSARAGNAALFRYLVNDEEPFLLSVQNASIQFLLRDAIRGGVVIWTVILERSLMWKDYEAPGHHGTVLEWTVELGAKDLLAFLLREGADVAVLEATSPKKLGADEEMLALIATYQKN